MVTETPKIVRANFSANTPASQSSSSRPTPRFLMERNTFSTKKERGAKPIRPPPKPRPQTCPPKSRLFKHRPEMSAAQSVTFLDSAESSSLHEAPLRDSQVYNSGTKVSYFKQAFVIESKIGSGCFGNVYRVRSKDSGQLFAVKIAKEKYRGDSDRREKLEEVRKHEYLLPHSNCVHFYHSWEENRRLYQQFELCEKSLSELSEEKHDLPEELVWSYLVDLLQAVKHLHDHELIHMDIKPENIFIGMDGKCKLGDFGLVLDLSRGDKNQFAEGDPKYLAAEVLHERNFSKAADIFALGATMLELACDLDLPAQGPLWHKLREIGPDPRITSHLSPDLRRVIQLMMVYDWKKRPTVEQLLAMETIQSRLKSRSRELAVERMKRNIVSVFNPVLIFVASLFCILTAPIFQAFARVWKYFTPKRNFVTPEHLVRKELGEENSSTLKNDGGSLLSFLTSTTNKKKEELKIKNQFSSDDEIDDSDNEISQSSSRSVLATALNYTDSNQDEDERTRQQLKMDLGEDEFDFPQGDLDYEESPSLDIPTPRKLQDDRSSPVSRWTRSPNWSGAIKKLKFEIGQDDSDDSPYKQDSKFDPDSSFGFNGSKPEEREEVQPSSSKKQRPIKPIRFDCFSDSDEDN